MKRVDLNQTVSEAVKTLIALRLGGGVASKCLSIAALAGLVSFAPSSSANAELAPTPILDTLHDNNTNIPNTNTLIPASEFTYNQITPADTNNLAANVIKYYNAENGSIQYYEINFKNSEYGSGSTSKYFKWGSNGSLVTTDNQAEAVITIHYNPEDTIPQYAGGVGDSIDSINQLIVGKDLKGFVGLTGTVSSATSDGSGGHVGNISSQFIGNETSLNNITGEYKYSTIYTGSGGEIDSITSNFIGNTYNVDSTNSKVVGPVIKVLGHGQIGNLTSEFVGNNVISTSESTQIEGGLINIASDGAIDNINSDFTRNVVTTSSNINSEYEASVTGGVIYNAGNTTVTNSSFIENKSISDVDDRLAGGAIYGAGGSTTNIQNTVFFGNSLETKGIAQGGAIYSTGNATIENTRFLGNYVSGSNAKGGAIYTTQDLTIAAKNGKLSEFTGNYTLNGSTKDYEAIYVNSTNNNATLTLRATDYGHILFNDKINGTGGYNLLLTGDNTGKISLYNTITDANVTAEKTNIDFVDSNFLDYNFLSLIAVDTARFSLDIDFASGKADTFTLGSGNGIIFIDKLNFLNGIPTTSKIIQVLTAPDTISISLSDELTSKYSKTTVKNYSIADKLIANANWGDIFGSHQYKDTIVEGLRTTKSSEDRINDDSIEYYVNKKTEDLGTVDVSDTMMLLNQSDEFTDKSFKATSDTDSYTVGADLGETYGTFTVQGYSSEYKNVVDANGHTLFEVGNGADVILKYLTFDNLVDQDGSLLTIEEGGRATLSYVDINGNEDSAAILNEGSLTLSGGTSSAHSKITGGGIKGDGTTTISSSSYWEASASALQDTILSSSSSYLYLNSGTLNNKISGSGTTYINNNSTITTDAGNLGTVTRGVNSNGRTNGSVINLTGGELNSNIYSTTINVTGDVTIGSNGKIGYDSSGIYTDINIAANSSLTTNASKLYSYYMKLTNDGVLNFTGGTFASYNESSINGTGTTNILGDVTIFNSDNSKYYVYNDIHVIEGSLTINANSFRNNVVNDSILKLTGGTIGEGYVNNLGGNGKTYIDGTVTAYYTNFSQDVEINSGKSLYTHWNRTFTDLTNNGTLYISNSGKVVDATSSSSHGVWDFSTIDNYSGNGVLAFKGVNSSYYIYMDIEKEINNNVIVDNYARVWANADDLGGTVTINGYSSSYNSYLTLTGGTINNKISGNSYGCLAIAADADVISNVLISLNNTSSSALTLGSNSSLTISADNLDANAYLNSGANLYLTSGTWNDSVSGSGTVTILSGEDVTHTSNETISSSVKVEDDAIFTASATYMTGSVTNDGELYLSGLLSRKYNGSGTIYINDELQVSRGAGYLGTFDLNDGLLSNYDSASIEFGHTRGSGDLILSINLETLTNTNFTLASTSNAIFDIQDIYWGTYKTAGFANSTRYYHVLKGGSSSYLTLNNIIEKDINIIEDPDYDKLGVNIYQENPENVYFDDEYNVHQRTGTVHATAELYQTGNTDDSLKVTYGDYIYEDDSSRIDLLSDWNSYSTTKEKNFNFRTSDDVYTSLASVGTTSGVTLNLNGFSSVDDEDNVKRSVIDLNGYSGFDMSSTNQNTVNLYNLEIRNSNGNVFSTNNDVFGTLLDDGSIQGGIVNSLFKNNKTTTSVLYFGANTLVHQIKDTIFDSNTYYSSNNYNYAGAIYNSGTISNILNTTFNKNYGYNYAGAIYNSSGIIDKISNTTFENNYTGNGGNRGGAIYNSGTINEILYGTFKGNYTNSYYNAAGAIYNSGTLNKIYKSVFEGNYANEYSSSNYDHAGAIYNSNFLGEISDATFKNNTDKSKHHSGGAIYNSGTLNKIYKSVFEGNSSTYAYYSAGGSIFNAGTINEIIGNTFTGNYSNYADDYSGGVICNFDTIDKIEDNIFIGNYSTSSVRSSDYFSSGVISNTGTIKEIINCIFKDNYATYTSYTSGAINTKGTMKITARGSVDEIDGSITRGLTEFTGNYVGSTSNNLAMRLTGSGSTTLNADTYGTILFNDKIYSGNSSHKLILTGDDTGTIKLFDTVSGNLTVSADSTNILTANGKILNWDITSGGLSSDTSAKWTIDIDFANNQADTFGVVNGTGTMYLDQLNILGDASEYTKVQILNKTAANTTVLDLNSDRYHIVTDVRDTIGNTVYSDQVFHQEDGYAVTSSYSWDNIYGVKDSISRCVEEDLDGLSILAASKKDEVRNFIFRDASTYNVIDDLENVYTGNLKIIGVSDENGVSTINADGHSLFRITDDDVTIDFTDVHVTGADIAIQKSSSAKNAVINLTNATIDGDIISQDFARTYSRIATFAAFEASPESITINIAGTETALNGNLSSINANLNAGALRIGTNTFANSNTYLNINEGSLALNTGTTETYNIYNLSPGDNGKLALDVDLYSHSIDKISVTNSSGVITISSIDYINGIPSKSGEYILQVIHNNSNNADLQLILDDSLKHYIIGETVEDRDDSIMITTDFHHTYYNRRYEGIAEADIEVTTTETDNDSLKFVISPNLSDEGEINHSMGDTLYLVNDSDLETRNFSSSNSSDNYGVSVDLDETAAGTMNLVGTLDVTSGDRSTINFKNHDAFHIGDDTQLSVKEVRLTGARDIITVDGNLENNNEIILNNAHINGNIIGNKHFNMEITGTDTTTILGKVTNSDVVFANGGLVIAENTFADENVTIEVRPNAYVHLNDGDVSHYVFNNITSSRSSKFGLDLDLETRAADMITAEGSGLIVFEKFDIVNRNVSDLDLNSDYTIQILKTSNDSLQLAISETVLQQLDTEYKIGTVHEIIKMDTVLPVATWGTRWEVIEGDYDVYGKIKLATTETANDSLHLYELRTALSQQTSKLGDTLMLISILETDTNRRFYTDSATDRYDLTVDIGKMSAGQMSLEGKTDANGNHSIIDMHAFKGFQLDKETHLIAKDVTFENASYKDGALVNVSNSKGVLDLANVTIQDTASTNAIKNAGTVNLNGGKVLLYSGITGDGTTNVTNGAEVEIFDGMSFTQSLVNVANGYLTLNADSVIYGDLTIGTQGKVKTATDGITTDVDNDGHIIFTGGELEYNINGSGVTDIVGRVVNSAVIDQNVDVQKGEFTTSADNIGGFINNDAYLNLTGTLKNVVTGTGKTYVNKTLTLAAGAGIEGTLDLNDGKVSTSDNQTSDYVIGTMLDYGSFDIDIDLEKKKSDKFIVGNDSSGRVYLDNINFMGQLGLFESFKIQVLQTHGTDAIQLALNDALTREPFIVGYVTDYSNDLRPTVYFDEFFHDKKRDGVVYGILKLATTDTTNDSIELEYTDTIWGALEQTTRKDTLKELVHFATNEDKNFMFRTSSDKYIVKEDLGEATAGNFNITGVAGGDNRSKIDFTDNNNIAHSGFELSNKTTLSISNVEMDNAKDDTLITVTNNEAVINLTNDTLHGDIKGSGNVINITGSEGDVTTLDGRITNSKTTFNGGTLRFNTNTFGDGNDVLNVVSGHVDMQDNRIKTYDVTKLTSLRSADYLIDVDLNTELSDKISITNQSSNGTVYLDNINFMNGTVLKEFIAQVLDTHGNNNIQILLSDRIKSTVYDFGTEDKVWDDLRSDVYFDEFYHDYTQEIILKGKIKEATTATTNDSIELVIDQRIDGEISEVARKDTLKELSQYDSDGEKYFRFKTAGDTYNVKEDIGQATDDTLNILGVADGENRSEIDFTDNNGNAHTGFELSQDTTLNITNVEMGYAKNNTLVSVSNEDAVINLTNDTLHGDILGAGNAINIVGKNTDLTTLDGRITKADTTFNGGTLRFNTNTFADKDDTLDVISGHVDLQNRKVETYEVTKLTSSEKATYGIDVDLTSETADMIDMSDTSSSGYVYIDDINFMNGDLPKEFIAQILETHGNSDIKIILSEEIKKKVYNFGNTEENWDDLKADVYFDEFFNDYHRDGFYKGSIKEDTTKTEHDSISLKVEGIEWGETSKTARTDTLSELSRYETDKDKYFRFKTAGDTYTVKADLGKAIGKNFNILGVANGTSRSEIDFTDNDGNAHSGFELSNDTTLTITNMEMDNAKHDILIDVTNTGAKINLTNDTLHGHINGVGTSISITGKDNDVTTLDGRITNSNTTFNGGTLRFNTDTFAHAQDTLDVISGHVDFQDKLTKTYDVTKLTSSEKGHYSIDVDLSAQLSDKINITDKSSSGIVYIDNINFMNGKLPIEFLAQVLETHGNNNIQIRLSDDIKKTIYDFGTTEENWDDLRADVTYDEWYHDYHRDGVIKGSIKEATKNTKNDSIELKMDAPIWGETVETTRTDTLGELARYDTKENKYFRFKTAEDTYNVKANLGEATDGNLNVLGVADGDSRSQIDFSDKNGVSHTGFELNNETTLNLSNLEMDNAKHNTLIEVGNSKAVINLTNDILHGHIKGAGNTINITGVEGDLTVLDGRITNSNTTFNGGTLRFNTDTFADEKDTLDVVSGYVDFQDKATKTYDVTKLTSSRNAHYGIDIDLSAEIADKINITDQDSYGYVYIDKINFMNGELPSEFIAQILDTHGNSNIQIKLSDEIKSTIYDFGKTERNWDDLKPDVDYDEFFHDYHQEGDIKGSIKEDTTSTTNDSISLKMEAPIWGEIETSVRLDTLHEISDYVVDQDKTFNFKMSEDVYKSKADVGELHGTLSINGVKDADGLSQINLKKFKGFELVEDSKLNVNNTRISNGADNILITARDSSAEVTLNNSQVDGVITGEKGYTVNITGDKDHIFDVRNNIKNANVNIDTVQMDIYVPTSFDGSNVTMNSGILNMAADRRVADLTANTFHIGGTFDIWADVDLRNEVMDKLPSNTTAAQDTTLNVSKLNLLSDTTATSVAVPFAYKGFKDNVKYTGPEELSENTQISTVYAPIFKYKLKYDNRDDMGYFVFSRSGMNPGSSDSYNPAIMASAVSTQAAGNAAINETFRYVFEHADAFTQLPEVVRTAKINANKYALSSQFNDNLGSLCYDHDENEAAWFRPYSTFENINLANGPKVDTISYGSLVGFDTDFHRHKNGWASVTTGYLGYMGSQLHYGGVDTTMNGGLLGVTQTYYKGNFWSAFTASVGAGVTESHTMYGKEDTTMLMAGIANKSGYNFEFKDGKYILQPIAQLSYTMVKTFDYTNAADIRIENAPMHTIQLHPSVRFISNYKNGWQPYAQVGMVWNLMNESNVTAAGIHLPSTHTKPYVEYGVGVQRNWNDKFSAFGQAMVRNGGRNGIAFTAGFRWALGRDSEHVHNKVQNTPDVQRTQQAQSSASDKTSMVQNVPTKKIIKQLDQNTKDALMIQRTTITANNASIKKL